MSYVKYLAMRWMCTAGYMEGGREGEELRMLNIYDTLDLLVISLMRSGVYVSE